ncbi:lysylphosphatidylglycerol synthase transmembrane domain-containing protein [Robertmurraya sp. P23]|uniref:lysylphosphatidylglycerol synthase transmembrane domain-containing protein n=1 Tax=Robertmurraya sp. P23 TaxID=3436931 RepID=UPI003D97A109
MRVLSKKIVKNSISLIIILIFIVLTTMFFDASHVWNAGKLLAQHPFWLLFMFGLYFLSFCLKAVAWKLYLKGKPSIFSCLIGILYSLFINHLLPIKVGDLVRAEVLKNREKLVNREEAYHSVIVLRVMDMFCLIGITFVGLLALDIFYSIPTWLILGGLLLVLLVLIISRQFFSRFLQRQFVLMKSALLGWNGFVIIIATLISWILEAGVLYGTVHILTEKASLLELAFVNSLTIAGQVFQVTPGGIANYESVMTFGLGIIGISLKVGYTIAVFNHAIKFFFSYIVGAFCFWIHPINLDTIKSLARSRGVSRK